MSLHAPVIVCVGAAILAVTPAPLHAQTPLTARDAWVRAAPTAQMNTAAFAVLENRTDREVVIVSVASTASRVTEMHEMRDDNGIMRMRRIERLTVPPRGVVTLKPGGLHLMLMGLTAPLQAGATVTLTLTFADGSSMEVAAGVRPLS